MNVISAEPGIPVRAISLRDRLLFTLTVSSGAVDAISFIALGKVFTAFMTGNIAFLGLGISQNPKAPSHDRRPGIDGRLRHRHLSGNENRCPTSIWIGRMPGASWRGVAATHDTCAWAIAAGASRVRADLARDKRKAGENAALVLLVVWAMAMGMQSGAVRRLNVSAVFTTAATATLIFVVGDLAHEPLMDEERRRLVAVLLSLVLGATAGRLLLLHARLYAPLFPLLLTAGVVLTADSAFRTCVAGDRRA